MHCPTLYPNLIKLMFILLTVRSFSYELLSSKANSLINSLGGSFTHLGIAIDSRGSEPTAEDWLQLSACFPSLKLSFFRSNRPGKSAAQRDFALNCLESGQYVLLNDLRCQISVSSTFGSHLLAGFNTDIVSFPVSFDSLVSHESLYFRLENKLRSLEHDLGICFVSSGQLMLVKSDLLRHLPSDVGDDCYLPLYAQLFSNGVTYSHLLKGHDFGHTSSKSQFVARRRMVVRNLPYTFISFFRALGQYRVFLALAIFFHKIFRWFALFSLPIGLVVLSICYLNQTLLLTLTLLLSLLFTLVPKVRNITFGLFGIFAGFIDVLRGKRISFY